MLNFQADHSNADTVATRRSSDLTISGIGSGTVGLDTSISVTASDAGTGTASAADLSTAFGTPGPTFATGDGSSINSSTATLDVNDDRRLEGDETVNLTIGSLSST